MNLVAFDTSTQWLSVACMRGDDCAERSELAGQAHSERLLPRIDEVMAELGLALGDLDAIAFGAGPGSFTGVRIACGVAQGLGLGADRPLIPVSTLEALAHTAFRRYAATRVMACLDARMKEVYVAHYVRVGADWTQAAAPAVLHPAEVVTPPGTWFGAGDGFAAYPELGAGLAQVDASVIPEARSIAELAFPRFLAGEAVRAADARPLYVRHRVALTTAQREAGARM